MLFVVDEVITGFGRLGEWFAGGRFGLSPDMMVVAKGLTSLLKAKTTFTLTN